jgi:hypothetical protein
VPAQLQQLAMQMEIIAVKDEIIASQADNLKQVA